MSKPSALTTVRLSGSDGLSLAADVGGDPRQPTVVLLHGGGQTRHSWSGASRTLVSRGYHVINYDARGHGDSDWSPRQRYRMQDLADDLRAVLAALPPCPALVGASLGAATALELLGSASDPVASGLVLVDLVPRAETEGVRRIRAFMSAHPDGFASLEEAADAVAAYYPHRPRSRDPRGLLRNLRRRSDGRLLWHWDPAILADANWTPPCEFAERLLAAARRVRVPTLLVRGERSDIVGDAGVAELRAALPQLEVASVAGAGHMVAGDRNDAFSAAVLDFLDRHLPRPSRPAAAQIS